MSLQVGLLSADLRCDLLRFARPPRTLRSAYIPPQGAKASQARCRGFESRLPLHFLPFRPRHNVAACHGAGVAVRDAPGTSQGRTGGLAAAWRATHQSSHREPVSGMARREREPVSKPDRAAPVPAVPPVRRCSWREPRCSRSGQRADSSPALDTPPRRGSASAVGHLERPVHALRGVSWHLAQVGVRARRRGREAERLAR